MVVNSFINSLEEVYIDALGDLAPRKKKLKNKSIKKQVP